MDISPPLYSAALMAVRDCLGLQARERTLVVTDEPLRVIG